MANLTRATDDRLVAGVSAGLARHVGLDPLILRLAFVVAALGSGLGVLAYFAAWALMPGGVHDPDAARDIPPGRSLERATAVGLVTVGSLLLVRQTGIWFADGLVWPATVGAIGLGFVWSQADEVERARWARRAGALQGDPVGSLISGRAAVVRLAVGIALLFVGLGAFVAANDRFAAVGAVAMALLAAAVGAGLLLGPWIARLFRDLAAERRERIRVEERAEVAAHLHDSVLQTLALIQRRADSPSETVALARHQERELRSWLYGGPGTAPDRLGAALAAVVDEAEAAHPVQIDLVVVGDAELDPSTEAVVAATREAVVNAAKHAGVDEVSVYAEADETGVTVYVRDRGKGFDPAVVDPDRKGLRSSITGRMHRHGGTATITSAPGEGTEVVLEVGGERR